VESKNTMKEYSKLFAVPISGATAFLTQGPRQPGVEEFSAGKDADKIKGKAKGVSKR